MAIRLPTAKVQVNSALAERLSATWQRQSWLRLLGWAIVLCFVLRMAFALFALGFSAVTPLYRPCDAGVTNPERDGSGVYLASFGVWRQWDTCWYELIVARGYQPGSGTVAFFPLFPLLLKAAELTLGELTIAGAVVASVAYVAGMVGLYKLIEYDFDPTVARRTVMLLSLFPSAFYLVAPYTESLFLALAVWTLYTARRGHWGWAVALALLASLTRTQGCLLALPLAWEVVRQLRGSPWDWSRVAKGVALVTGPGVGLVGFIAYTRWATGWTTLQAQSVRWGAEYRFPWELARNSLRVIVERVQIVEAINLLLVVIALVLFGVGVRSLPATYSLYAAPQLLLLITRETSLMPLASANRYLLVIFPLFTVMALLLTQRRHRVWWGIFSLSLMAILLVFFLNGGFVA